LLESLFVCSQDIDVNDLLRCLICTETTALLYGNETLLRSILRESHMKYEMEAFAKVIYRLACTLPLKGKCMNLIFDAILRLSSSEHKQIRIWGARSLYKQSLVEARSFFFTRTPAALKTIIRLSGDEDSEVQYIGTKIIGNLVSHRLNQRTLTKNASLMASLTEAVEQRASKEAVKALLNLADNSKYTKTLAKQHNVVSSLSMYGSELSAGKDNKELKRAALSCVTRLVPLM
ncbi:MAG: hypothetical protein SGILL_003464, partial [Bacillariaceae sp.]